MMHRQAIYIISAILLVFGIVFGTAFFAKNGITGNVVSEEVTGNSFYEKESEHSEQVGFVFNGSGVYNWSPKSEGTLKSLRATGSVTTNGSAKVFIEKDGVKYVLFDSTKHLFDIDIHVLPEYKKIYRGDEVLIQIVLFNLRGFGSGNVTVTYSIKDENGNLLALEKEDVYVETQAKFVRKLIMPSDISTGTYFAYVEVNGETLLGSGSDTFEVKSKVNIDYGSNTRVIIISMASLATLAIVIMLVSSAYREHEMKRKIEEIKEKHEYDQTEKLKTEIKSLDAAFQSKFISEESFMKQKTRIEDKLKQANSETKK